MRAVNLLPTTPRTEARRDAGQDRGRTTRAVAVAAGLALVLVAVLVGFAFVQGRSDVSDRQTTLDGIQAEVAQTQAAAALTAAVAAQRQSHLAAVTSAASGRTAWDRLLFQLSRVMPQGAWLESLQTTVAAPDPASTSTDSTESAGSAVVTSNALSSSSAPAPAAATLTVTGFARSQATVPSVLERLALIPALSDVSLQSTQRADVAGKTAVQFTVNANVVSAGGIG
jgi:Tfp pilus assembly protein PilN